jgi:tetratricopeptide (TPR) repeat protein
MNQRIEQLQQMLAKEPEDLFLQFALALETDKLNETDKAISILESILDKDKNYLAAYYQLGKMLQKTNHNEKAKKVFLRGIEIAKDQRNQKTERELKEALNYFDE